MGISRDHWHKRRATGGKKCPIRKKRKFELARGSEAVARKTRIIDVVYNACNNELVRTKTLVKNSIIVVDAAPFRQWYEGHYALPLGRKKGAKLGSEEVINFQKVRKPAARKKLAARRNFAKVAAAVEEQFLSGKLLACIKSRPGQSGRCDGYVLEGKELEFYLKKIKTKKSK